jgi:RNA polymerase sigma-70 factor (ECF subfamily)
MASERDPPGAGVPQVSAEAERDLYSRFATPLRVLATRTLGDLSEAEDVTHDALGRVLQALRAGRIRQLAALPAFVYETGRHLCLQRLRRRGRTGRVLLLFGHETLRAAEEPGALGALLRAERIVAVRRALAALGPEERELLRLAFAEALTSEEIGRRLGLEAGAVRVRKHRLLGRLGEILQPRDDPGNGGSRAGT